MEDHTRRAVAYLAGRVISSRTITGVYDYESAYHFHFSGRIASTAVTVYDHDEFCFISGPLAYLYHHGNGGHIQLRLDGFTFSGYDLVTSTQFRGEVNDRALSIHDGGLGRRFHYAI